MSLPLNTKFQAQINTPLLNRLQQLSNQQNVSFYTPGHKRGQGINQSLQILLGKQVFQADLPELPELDNLFAPKDVIAEAQELAALAFGATQTWFLVNGSSCGIIASIVAICGMGEKIILPRNVHTSAIAGLILSGAIPIFIEPEYAPVKDLVYSITPTALEQILQQHPDAKAVMLLYPTYQGICGDISAITEITHQYNIPLLVDEAHGAHFAFHPDLPPSALSAGADLTIQSTHKVLGAMTQAAMLHIQGDRIDPLKISKALQLLQSTSPSYLLLASLDAARQQMALEGKKLLTETIQLAEQARNRLTEIAGISVLEFLPQAGFTYLDRTRLTVDVSQLGLTGFEADEILHQQLGVTCELPLPKQLTFIITFGNTQEDIDKLIQAFNTLSQSPLSSPAFPASPSLPSSPLTISPREAFFSATETLPIQQSINRICGELICPYPPGIPVLMPGETITPEAIDYLQQVLALGGTITGCSDPSLKTIQVINSGTDS